MTASSMNQTMVFFQGDYVHLIKETGVFVVCCCWVRRAYDGKSLHS